MCVLCTPVVSQHQKSGDERPSWTLRELRVSEHLWWHRSKGFSNRLRSVWESRVMRKLKIISLNLAAEHIWQDQARFWSEEEGRRTKINKRYHLRCSEKDQRRISKEQQSIIFLLSLLSDLFLLSRNRKSKLQNQKPLHLEHHQEPSWSQNVLQFGK